MEESVPRVPPVLDMLHQLRCCQEVTGAIQDGTVGDMSCQIHIGNIRAAELSSVDGSGTEGAVAAFPYSLLHLFLDGCLQITSFDILSWRRSANIVHSQ